MNCYETIDLMGDALEGCLAADSRPAFGDHLEECAACRNYLEQLRLTLAALEHLPPRGETSRRRTELIAEFRRQFRRDG